MGGFEAMCAECVCICPNRRNPVLGRREFTCHGTNQSGFEGNSQNARPEMGPIALLQAHRDRCETMTHNLEEGRRIPISFT